MIKKIILVIICVTQYNLIKAQNIGGFESGQVIPQAAKPYDLKSGVISGNVNLFDGSYNYTQPLASITTPSGLSYSVQLSYNSTNQTGNNPKHLSGVPYGDGWNIAIPNIQISTGSYSKYGDCGVDFGSHTNPTALFNRAEALIEGQLYWMAPVLNIPGIVSGRMVYKYSDNLGPVFVMHEFEQYVEARFSGEYWEVKLWDGTVWEFKQQQVSYRNAVDQRIDLGVTGADGVLQNLTIPKIEAASFYATRVYNPNHPAGNSIQFEYDVFGTFNFHKEHLQSNVIYGYKFLDLFWRDTIHVHTPIINLQGDTIGIETDTVTVERWELPSSSLTNTVPEFTGFNASSDFFLKGIYSFSTGKMIYEKIELDYKTFDLENGVNLPMISDAGVERYDSLYNISSIYKINNSNNGFTGWNRYRHWRSDEVVSDINVTTGGNFDVPYMQTDNPYVGKNRLNAFDRVYQESVTSGVSGVAFDHSFLESPKIMGGVNTGNNDYIVPGEIYEIKTKIRNNNMGYDRFCNFDINLVTGPDFNNLVTDLTGKDFEEFSKERTYPLFSTFNKSIKWNNILHGVQGTTIMTTSNLFTMPTLPMSEFEGFHIQVGPSNSDQMFTADHAGIPETNYLDIIHDQVSGNNFLNAESTYYNENSNLTDSLGSLIYRTGNPIKNNFGIGNPWHMVKPLYERAIGVIDATDKRNLYAKWWNYSGVTNGWENEPTRANENVFLQEVELLRYSKNTYLLHKVKHYKLNGEYIKSGTELYGEGVRLVSEFEFDYVLITSETKRDYCAEFSPCDYQEVIGKRNIINLKSIIQNPIKNIENLNPVYTYFDYDTIQNPFEPYTLQITKEDGTVKTINVNTAMMGSSHINVLSQITNKLGGITNIEYYPFTHPNTTYEFTSSDKKNPSFCYVSANSTSPTNQFKPSNNLAFSLKPAVKQVIVKENGFDNVWDYEYFDKERKGYQNHMQVWNGKIDGIIGLGQTGYTKTKVYEPFLDQNNPTKRAYSIHQHYTDSTNAWSLFGKLKNTMQYDENDNLLAETESIYGYKMAYSNGKRRHFNSTLRDYSDYYEYAATPNAIQTLEDEKLILYAGINPILFAESERFTDIEGLNNRYLNSYFVYKIKDVNTYYEYTNPPNTNTIIQIVDIIDDMLLNFLTYEDMVDYTRAVDSNQLDSADVFLIYDFSKILQTSYLKYYNDSLELSWMKKTRNQKDEYKSIKVPFADRDLLEIVDRDLASTIFLKLNNQVKQDLYIAFAEDNTKETDNVSDFLNESIGDTLKIDLITEYQYWDANYDGKTTSNGFEILLQQNSTLGGYIQLLDEPSWQLFSKTTYSPQQPETFNREEYYYLFDLQNTWIGNKYYNNPEKHIQYKICKNFGMRDLVYEVDNIQKTINNKPVIKYNYLHYWDEWITDQPYHSEYSDRINFSSLNIDSIPDILLEANFLHAIIDSVNNTIIYNDSVIVYNDSINQYDLANDPLAFYGCISIPKPVAMGWAPINPPAGFYYYINDTSDGWYCPDSIRYLFSMPSDPYLALNLGTYLDLDYVPITNFTEVKNPDENIYYQIDQDSLENTIAVIMNNSITANTNANAFSVKSTSVPQDTLADYLPFWLLNLGKLHLKEAYVNIDTLDLYPLFDLNLADPNASVNALANSSYLPENYHSITRWHMGTSDRLISALPVPICKPLKPFATKKLFTIEERNNFAQPYLVKDEKDLITRYTFSEKLDRIRYTDTYTGQHYETWVANNIALPTAITIGIGLEDSLRSTYEYTDEKNIAAIIDPNGMRASYTYDDFSRLKSSYLNGHKLDLNMYNYWNGDKSLTYDEKALQNYSEKHVYFDAANNTGNKIRNYVEPTGKDYGSLSQAFSTNPLSWHQNILYSGEIVLDKWGRAIKSFKAFETSIADSTVREIPKINSDSTFYPQAFIQTAYEPNQRSRPLKTADFGIAISDIHILNNEYKLVTGLQAAVELELNNYEKDLLFGTEINDFVFKRTKTIDQDAKINFLYSDAFDRKIAMKQVLDKDNFLITLFMYDALGNVAKVINPKKQESDYEYNLEGLLYRKTTPDEGVLKFRYNKAKQVVLQQDANFSSTNWLDNKYRAYKYDAFGNLIEQFTYGVDPNLDIQNRVISGSNIYENTTDKIMDLPLYYDKQNFTSGSNLPFSFIATYYDVESFQTNPVFNFQPSSGTFYSYEILSNQFDIIDSSTIKLEKRFEYNRVDTTDRSIHINARLFITNSSDNLKGKIARSIAYDNDGFPVQYSLFSYNDVGTLKWEMKQFNANGLNKNDHGFVYRIDYKDYDYQGNLLTKNVDINSDFTLDAQYHYTYDEWNRLSETYFNMNDSKAAGNKIASFHYDNASGKLLKTNYYKKAGTVDVLIDSITYYYDLRERLTDIKSNFFDWAMYYDGNNLANVNNSNNYNGNINATKATYKLSGYSLLQSMFSEPTSYGYEYDNINRLTKADAHYDISNTNIGDADYGYDVIGNLLQLNRYIPGATAAEEFTYQYQTGSNRLLAVNSSIATNNRNYSYDANGNLLSDSYKKLNHSEYGRANLPVALNLENGEKIDYLFDEADDRMYKNFINEIGVSKTKEYYLKDASGKTFSIYDFNTDKFEWYMFGANRTAKTTPNTNQQPGITITVDNAAADGALKSAMIADNKLDEKSVQLKTTLMAFETKNYGYPDELFLVRYADQSEEIILGKNFNDKISQNPNLVYEKLFSTYIENEKQSITLEKNLLNYTNLAVVNDKESVSMTIEELLSINTTTPVLDTALVYDFMASRPAPAYDPFTDSSYTLLSDTELYELTFYVYDHLGNTRVTYEPKFVSGVLGYDIKGVFDYYPYGKTLRQYNLADEKYLTTQHQRDAETGFDYRGARFYDADIARFLSVDPHAVSYPSLNNYHYVGGNPISFIDPTGRDSIVFNSSSGNVSSVHKTEGGNKLYDETGLNYKFNDPELDSEQLDDILPDDRYNWNYNTDKIKAVFVILKKTVQDYMDDSGVQSTNSKSFLSRWADGIWKGNTVYDFAPKLFYDYSYSEGHRENGVFRFNVPEGTGGLFVFKGESTAFNLYDAGNFLTGQAYQQSGFNLSSIKIGAQINEFFGDSEADQKAIEKGYNYKTK